MDGLWLIPACLAAGGLIGFSGGVLGIGGGLFAIPLLGLILGYEQQAAQGTALIMVLPAILLTLRKYHQHAPIDWRSAAAGAVSCAGTAESPARILGTCPGSNAPFPTSTSTPTSRRTILRRTRSATCYSGCNVAAKSS